MRELPAGANAAAEPARSAEEEGKIKGVRDERTTKVQLGVFGERESEDDSEREMEKGKGTSDSPPAIRPSLTILRYCTMSLWDYRVGGTDG